MNYKKSLLALLLVSCSSALSVDFNGDNEARRQEMFCRTMADLKDRCADQSMLVLLDSLDLEFLQNDRECVDLACRMARMMRESEGSLDINMIMNAFCEVEMMKVIGAYILCQVCLDDLMRAEESTDC